MILTNEQSEEVVANTPAEESLLKDIREDYRYCLEYWQDIRAEAATDMRYVSGDPWAANDRAERSSAGRPVLSPDELSQYLKQANNNLRQNKRSIKVNPKGQGATDKDAERRAAIIRGIEYQSNAQAAYTTGFEQCTESSFGAWRIINQYINDSSDEQEPRIKRIPNQFTVLFDPMAKEADRSDQNICFVLDRMRETEFSRRWPEAKKRSFSKEDKNTASDWFQGDEIIVAEYWKREEIKGKKLRQRQLKQYKVTQYITNGLEILETNEWPGSWIPIIGVFGEEIYTNDGGQSKLHMFSMIRRARGPQMMLAYIASQEAEEFGMAPRAPYLVIRGQIDDADIKTWQQSNKVPVAFLQYNAILDGLGTAVLPPPIRQPFIPNVASYETAKESWRRQVQASMGQTPLPTSAQRQNEKSGVALEKIQTQMAIGSYNFTDNFDRALENTGRQLNELITKVIDTPRQVGTRQPDESHELLHVLQSEHVSPEMLQKLGIQDDDYLIADRGEFDVTISTGPSYQSQRELANEFGDLIVQELANIPIQPQAKAAVLAKVIKMKNIGPFGDEMADLIDPNEAAQDPIPPQAQAQLAQLQMENKAIDAHAQELTAQVQKLEFEKAAKVLDNKAKLDIEKLKIDAQIATAEITTKAQSEQERTAFVQDVAKQVMSQMHEAGMAGMQQAGDQQSQQADQQHEAQMSQMGHDQAMEQQDQAGQQALTQQQMAQEAQPSA